MNATFTKILTTGPLFKDALGVLHISRTSEQDIECKLLNGNIQEFGFLSAIREVGDVESAEGFVPSKDAYEAIARDVHAMAEAVDGSDFAWQYREVARLVLEYAHSL